MKSGIVCIVGRPNAGKSTLVNAILKQKVSITSPKPQTTRFAVHAVYEDQRGQIIFVDTPGIFERSPDLLSKKVNKTAQTAMFDNVDVILYVIDHTRERNIEENKVLGLVRKTDVPKILAFNKIDIKTPTHRVQYKFMEEEFNTVLEISALKEKNIALLLNEIFTVLPEGEKQVDTERLSQPGISMDSKTFVSEIIREKAFLFLREELPYKIMVVTDELTERESGTLYIKARIVTNGDKYKRMIVGKNGAMIKEISMAARKELETATDKNVYIDLTVEADPHWMDYYQ